MLAYLMSWLGKPSPALSGGNLVVGVHISAPDTDFGLEITDTVTLIDPPTKPDATLVLPTESSLRLASGRLGAAVTPPGVTVTGPLDLHTLRAVFPASDRPTTNSDPAAPAGPLLRSEKGGRHGHG